MQRHLIGAACVLLVFALHARAVEPFTLDANGVSASDHSLTDLVENLIDSKKEFASLNGQNINGTLRYGGVDDAVLFTRNAAGTSATLTIPSTGFSKTFTAANQAALEKQVEDFFKKKGATAYAAFLREMNQRTTLGVTDGNPLAVTAMMADGSFYRFGFQSPRFDLGEGPRMPAGFEIDAAGGVSDAEHGDGYFATLKLGSTFRMGDQLGLSIILDGRYRNVEDAAVYEIDTVIGLPIMLVPPKSEGGLSWMLTPAFVVGFGGSWDLAAGGFPIGGQITSSLAARVKDWTFVLANQYGYYDGIPITISDFKFDTDISQSILKNGVQVIKRFGNAFADAGIAYTNLLDEAAIDSWWSPELGVGVRWKEGSGVRVAYRGDYGDGFTNHGAGLQLYLAY